MELMSSRGESGPFVRTVCPGTLDSLYIVNYHANLVKTSWIDSTDLQPDKVIIDTATKRTDGPDSPLLLIS